MEANVKRAAKAKVSERAIIARINRALAPQDMKLKTSRGSRMKLDVGDYYVINTRINGIVQPFKFMSLPDIAHEIGVLADWEEIDYSERAV
jgi:hypothetical protein